MSAWIAILAAAAAAGLAQALAGWLALRRFRHRTIAPPPRVPITILKPLHGDEPLLEAALASLCALDYTPMQIVCGVQDPADPAIAVVERLRARFPGRDIAVVADATPHGLNRKIANLINMFSSAKHDTLVIADSDVHVTPAYLDAILATLATPDCGLATLLYTGRPASDAPAALLGTAWINHAFLPGALLARALGRQDCLGATMALRRETLVAIGGLESLADDLADDQMLGRRVRALGLSVGLAGAVVATTVPETTLGALWRHELRWGRTIRSLEPVGFALSALQYPLAWALLAIALSGAAWSVVLFLAAWLLRAAIARLVEAELRGIDETLATRTPVWLFPLRDLLSIAVWIAAHAGTSVEWRGQVLDATRAPPR
ncbi:MAG: bacteriohopanetetrol glucosamine biosynthesis glycosyltransferase HpnI [Alphaproteobacteria bacterium]|nr:bacteriohopanetetrol glucosamine biosynthesis glycosyltransferase HpnI [Alphaproteobacteria bacterium]